MHRKIKFFHLPFTAHGTVHLYQHQQPTQASGPFIYCCPDTCCNIYMKHFALFFSHINQWIPSSSPPMAINQFLVALFFTLALAKADQPNTSQLLKGSVTCLDCPQGSDLSGVQVLVKCDKVKKLSMTYTEEDGTFGTELPSDGPTTANPLNCMAKIMGGPHQLYVSLQNSLIPVAQTQESSNLFTISKPLSFYNSCPVDGKCGAKDIGFGSSKTVDLPLPREWGLAPSSYYVPFIPIIGIP